MAWTYNPAAWVSGVTIPAVSDFQAIATDLHTFGGPVDGGGYTLANLAAATLVPGALPGSSFSVSGASWSGSVATITIGSHTIVVNEHITISGVTPSGYNVTDVKVTAVTGTTVSFALTSNPGTYSSGGTLLVGAAPGSGTLAVDSSSNLRLWVSSAWATIATTVVPLFTITGASDPTLHITNTGTGGSDWVIHSLNSAPYIGNLHFALFGSLPIIALNPNGCLQIFTTPAPSSNPTSGTFYMYMDSADSKLKVRGPSGTITTLANP